MDRKLYLIRKFFFESLNDNEQREFNQYALTDEKFRRMITRGAELHGMANKILGERIEDDPEFKRILEEERAQGAGRRAGGKEEEAQGRERYRNRKLFMYIGSGIAAVAIIGLVMAVLLRAPQNERIYTQYFAHVEMDNYRSAQQIQQESILLPLYQNKDFETIRAAADNPSILEKFSDLDYLLAGIAFMEGENFGKAEKMLSTITESSEHYYNAAWYLGLIRLRNNQIEDCRKYMRIARESLIFSEKALKIIDELKDWD